MPVNPGIRYQLADREFQESDTTVAKLKALQKMMATVPKHKSSEGLQRELKEKIAKYKKLAEKEKKSKKRGSYLSLKKEGAASVVIWGVTNSGKSTLLSQLTNAKPEISEHEFTTKKPEVGILDYKGVKIQLVELPAIVQNYSNLERGAFYLSIVRNFDLIVYVLDQTRDIKYQLDILNEELKKNDIEKKVILYGTKGEARFSLTLDELKEEIWNSLGLIKVYTKSVNKKKPDHPPVALKIDSTVRDLALHIHKDFVKKFIKNDGKSIKIIKTQARIWGKSAKFDGQVVGLDHVLEDEDVVELHLAK